MSKYSQYIPGPEYWPVPKDWRDWIPITHNLDTKDITVLCVKFDGENSTKSVHKILDTNTVAVKPNEPVERIEVTAI